MNRRAGLVRSDVSFEELYPHDTDRGPPPSSSHANRPIYGRRNTAAVYPNSSSTAIRAADCNGDILTMPLLLADPSAADNEAIWDAVRGGHVYIVSRLLTDSRIDHATLFTNIIQYAESHECIDVVTLLFPDYAASDSATIHTATDEGRIAVAMLLFADKRSNSMALGARAIWYAAFLGCAGTIAFLFANSSANPGFGDNKVIHIAACQGHVDVVALLLADVRVDPADSDNRAIKDAAQFGHIAVVRLLLADPRVDPTADGNRALHEATWNGHTDVVALLREDPRVALAAREQEQMQAINASCRRKWW